MKKLFIFLCLLATPLAGYAKYCPSCLSTFQAQTVHGQTKLVYEWLMKAMNPKYPLEKKHIHYLFDKNVMFVINGHRVARGKTGMYRYLLYVRKNQPQQQYKIDYLLIDQNKASIAYQTIFKKRGQKYHSLIIAILNFKGHKLINWWSVSHTTKIF